MVESPAENNFTLHEPVLLNELIGFANLKDKTCICDATLGLGGHSEKALEETSGCTYLGIDRDPIALEKAQARLARFKDKHKLFFINSNYSELETIFRRLNLPAPNAIFFDLGVSTMQLSTAERGFSFQKDGPLDMRMNPNDILSASDIVNTYSEKELVRIFSEYGEEHHSKRIAKETVISRGTAPLKTTLDLVNLIAIHNKPGRIHPATRVFQALRIAVNGELDGIRQAVDSAIKLLAPGGRLAVISFHSLEDRIVKLTLRKASMKCTCPEESPICTCSGKAIIKLISKKPITATTQETRTNPKSRSAKLRVGEKLK